jgi:hypothetical protein
MNCNGCLLDSAQKVRCSKCKSDLYKIDSGSGKCVCAGYIDGGQICQACDASCLKCDGAGPSSCTDCHPGMKPDGKACKCPVGTFFNDKEKKCVKCPGTCTECASEKSCSKCIDKFRVPSGGGVCECDLSKGQFVDKLDGNKCKPCHASCKLCTGALNTNCSDCDKPFTRLGSGKCGCVETTPAPTYYRPSDKTCAACHGSCGSCDDGVSCKTCADAKHEESSTTKLCTCSDTYYEKTPGNCQKCEVTCLTCSGATDSDCKTCPAGRELAGTKCMLVPTCKTSQYIKKPKTGDWVCDDCSKTCATCTSDSDKACLTCKSPRTFNSGVCKCPENTYSHSDGSCKACPKKCNGCKSDTTCISCAANFREDKGDCVCQDGRYLNPSSGYCDRCNGSCKTCDKSATQCESCYPGATHDKVKKTCTGATTCGNGFFYDKNATTSDKCVACDKSCKTCTGRGASSCDSCESYMKQEGSTCKCPGASYFDYGSSSCQPCD